MKVLLHLRTQQNQFEMNENRFFVYMYKLIDIKFHQSVTVLVKIVNQVIMIYKFYLQCIK